MEKGWLLNMSDDNEGTDAIEQIQQDFMKGYRKLKQRIGYLEKLVEDKKVILLEKDNELKQLRDELTEAEKGISLWEDTANSREQLLNQYKTRETDAFGMILKSVINYMDQYELYRDSVNRYAGVVLQSFRGLDEEQKEKFNQYIQKKTIEIENYAKRLKDGKV